MGKIKLIIGIILVLVGLGYLAAPQMLPQLGLTAMMQQALGVLLLLVGALLVWKRH